VKIFHPDVSGNNKESEKKFKEITEAYKILLKKFLKNEKS
jgi:DnaJ-class molecular chaperone